MPEPWPVLGAGLGFLGPTESSADEVHGSRTTCRFWGQTLWEILPDEVPRSDRWTSLTELRENMTTYIVVASYLITLGQMKDMAKMQAATPQLPAFYKVL